MFISVCVCVLCYLFISFELTSYIKVSYVMSAMQIINPVKTTWIILEHKAIIMVVK